MDNTTVLQVATAQSGLSKFFRSQRHCLKGFWRCKELREPSDVCLMCQSSGFRARRNLSERATAQVAKHVLLSNELSSFLMASSHEL